MGLISIEGTLSSIGQSKFDNDIIIYAYIEITKPSGERALVEKVAVCNDVAARLRLGQQGEFFIDRLFKNGPELRCQLWGLKADGTATLDSRNLRTPIMIMRILIGIPGILLFGLGLILIISSLIQLRTGGMMDRRRMFYGSADSQLVPPSLVVRI